MTEHDRFDHAPYDEAETARQVAGLEALLAGPPKRILDVGCGDGRIAGPLLEAARSRIESLVGVDRDEAVGPDFLQATDGVARFEVADLDRPGSMPSGPFDLVLVLGNLMMTVREPAALRSVFAGLAACTAPDGLLVMDDFAEAGWAEVASGRWADGVDDTGTIQMAWAPGDPEFAIRMGDDVDPEATEPRPGERVLRLWSRRELDDAARSGGFGPGRHLADRLLVVHDRSLG